MALTNAQREKKLMECEKLMLEGYTQATELARALKVARGTAISYIKIILKRWAEYWSSIERKDAAGRQLRKNESIQNELWEMLKKKKGKKKVAANAKIGALRTVIESVKVENRILGFDDVSHSKADQNPPETFDTYETWKKKRSKQQ